MTRIFTDGAEMQDLNFWDEGAGSWTVSNSSPLPFASQYYYKATNNNEAVKLLPSTLTECYAKFRYQHINSYGALGHWTIAFFSNSTLLGGVGSDIPSHYWYIFSSSESAVLETSDVIMQTGIWYLVELYYKLANAPDGRFVVYVDGIKIIDFSGDTLIAAPTTFDRVKFRCWGDQNAWDDLALNDTDNSDGKNDNSWCGDGVVIRITPSGSSATTNDWLNSGSVSGSANYLYVDEYPKDDDTTYTYASGSDVGLQTQFAMSDLSGIGGTILRIYPEARARKTTGEPDTIKLGFLASGGTDTMSGSANLTTGAYTRIVGDETKINPMTSASWTEADINALEFVAEVGSSG
jgi:hypothetical protein